MFFGEGGVGLNGAPWPAVRDSKQAEREARGLAAIDALIERIGEEAEDGSPDVLSDLAMTASYLADTLIVCRGLEDL